MNNVVLSRTFGWAAGLAAAASLQLWWWTGGGPVWLPVLTGPVMAVATLGINGAVRRRPDPEAAARAALECDDAAAVRAAPSGRLVGARQG